jgi:hypothetical protein
MQKSLSIAVITATIFSVSLIVGCESSSTVIPYPPFIELPRNERVAAIPIIIVGRVIRSVPVGVPHKDAWGTNHDYQLHRAVVQVENVLRGKVPTGTLDIYYFMDLRAAGMRRLGTVQDGGSWREEDREMFFLQENDGLLRTVCDTYAHCVLPVYSGRHDSAKPNSEAWIGDAIADILLTPGENSTTEEMVQAIAISAGACYDFSPRRTIGKLTQFVETGPLRIRQEACAALASLEGPRFERDPKGENIRRLCGS